MDASGRDASGRDSSGTIGRHGLRLASALAGLAALAAPALAADPSADAAVDAAAGAASSPGFPDIVVTAQRRPQSAQSVPIAASVFSADDLDARIIQSTRQLAQYVPNMLGGNNSGLGSANAYFIRGLGNSESIATFDPAVGTYVDEIYLPRQGANNFGFFDLDRIEVLRGPQGTLFGRNSSGGAINVVLKRPGTELAGFGEVSYGAYHRKTARGSLDLPLSPGIGLKLSGYIQEDRGYVRNTTTDERLNDNNGAGLRGALRIDLTPDATWNGSVTYIRADNDNLLNFRCDPANPSDCNGRFATTELSTTTDSYAPLVITGRKSEFGLGNHAETILYVSNLEWRNDAATLNVITGFVDLRQKYALDFADGRALPDIADPRPAVTGFPLGGFTILNDGRHQQFSQEIKLTGRLFGDRFDYVAGVYLSDETNTTDFADLVTRAGEAGPVPRLLADRILDNSARSLAGYFQGDLNLGAGLKLTAGIRYTDETKRLSILDNRTDCADACLAVANLVTAGGVPIPTRLATKQWTPRFAVNYKPNADLLVFATATRGFRSGGWNARAYRPAELLPFGPERVWSYEAGIKSEWFDHRLRANVTGFWVDAKGLQTPSALARGDGSVAFITQSFADMRNRGVEIELTAIPLPHLNLYIDAGFQDAGYRVDAGAADFNAYGVASVGYQQAQCRAQLASGQIPQSPNSAPAGAPPNNAPACAAGIVTASGAIADPLRTPRTSLAAGASYDLALPRAGIVLTPNVNLVYRSRYETGTANATIFAGGITGGAGGGNRSFAANPYDGDIISGSRNKGYALVNAGLALRTDDNNWTLAIECANCFDAVYVDSSLVNTSYLGMPRTWQVRAKRVF